MVAENLHRVAFAAVDVRHVDHADIHADVAHVGGALPVHQAVGIPVAQVAVQAIGVADGQGGDARVAGQVALAAIAHGVFLGHVAYLQNGGLEGAHILHDAVVYRVDPVEAEAEAHHVELRAGEPLDACRVADMAQDLVRECGLQLERGCLERLYLPAGEGVELRGVAAYQVREYGTGDDGILPLQPLYQTGHVGGGEAQAVHAGVQLDVDGEMGDALLLRLADEGFAQPSFRGS